MIDRGARREVMEFRKTQKMGKSTDLVSGLLPAAGPLPPAIKQAIIQLAEALARAAARMDHDRDEAARKP